MVIEGSKVVIHMTNKKNKLQLSWAKLSRGGTKTFRNKSETLTDATE